MMIRSSHGETCSCRPSPVSPDTRQRSCKCPLGTGLRGGTWTDPGHPIAARESFKVRGRSAHPWGNTGAPVLFQEQWPLEDPIALAVNLWNTMVSGWGSQEAAVPAWGIGPQEGQGLHRRAHSPRCVDGGAAGCPPDPRMVILGCQGLFSHLVASQL